MSADEIARACERLVVESAACNDAEDWSALAALYAPGARLTRPGGGTVEGREAIQRSYAGGPPDRRTRHLCTNVRVSVDDDEHAHATTTVLLVSWTDGAEGRPDADAVMVGEFADTFVLTADGWRIATRRAHLDVRIA